MFRKNKNDQTPRRSPSHSPNAPVFSYYSNRSRSETPTGRLQITKPRFDWKLLPTYIALTALVVSFVFVSTLDMNPRILRSKQSDSLVLQSDQTYQQASQAILKSSILNRSKLLVNTKKLEEQLKARFPELQTVAITIPLVSRRPIVAFEPANPSLALRSNNELFIVDDRGIAILKIDTQEPYQELNLPLVTDDSGLTAQLGRVVLPSSTTAFIADVADQLQAKDIALESMTLPRLPNELHLRIKDETYFVKFNTLGDPRTQTGTMIAARGDLAAKNVIPAEYIDVRVDEKAFYR